MCFILKTKSPQHLSLLTSVVTTFLISGQHRPRYLPHGPVLHGLPQGAYVTGATSQSQVLREGRTEDSLGNQQAVLKKPTHFVRKHLQASPSMRIDDVSPIR